MEWLGNSVRKIGRFFSSPPPASTLGKRKASSDEEIDQIQELDHADREGGSSTRDNAPGDDDSYHGYRPPQPPQKRIWKPTTAGRADTVMQSANEAMQRAQIAMGKDETIQVAQSDEQDIQAELERSQRQEDDDRKRFLTHQKKAQTAAARPNKGLVTASGGLAQTANTSKPKLAPKLSDSKTSDPRIPLAMPPREVQTSKEQWSTKPNLRARQLLEEHGHDATALLKDLQEPTYACRDAEMRDCVWKMTTQIENFAKEHFGFKIADKTRLRPALRRMQKETVKIIGCVASGGPAGASGWEDLFLANDKRQALVCAIVGNVLVEQVLQHLFFGGTEDQIKQVAAIQFEHRHRDGFDRNALYARKIREFLTPTSQKGKAPISQPPSLHLPSNFNNHINHIVAALYTHLKPILHLSPSPSPSTNTSIIPPLHSLTTLAGLLSLQMRLDPHTAYHVTPAFKDHPFHASEMECLNHSTMIATHPRGAGPKDHISKPEQERRAGLDAKELQRMKHDEGLVQITLLPGLTAFRLGGWETLSSSAEKVQYEDGCEAVGVRARRLTDAWVYCRWGRRRVWKDARPADEPEVHGVAWKEGGFVEFFPGVEGVADPDPGKTKRRGAAKDVMVEKDWVSVQ